MKLLHVEHRTTTTITTHEHDHDSDDHHEHRRPRYHGITGTTTTTCARRTSTCSPDAFTSVLAILALLGGRYFGWRFLDPLMGIVGGVVISRWSYGLCRGAARQLLDVVPSAELAARIRQHLEDVPGTEVVDLHLWEIGPKARACIASVFRRRTRSPLEYAEGTAPHEQLAHVTVEVHRNAT